MRSYNRNKKIKDIEAPSNTVLFPVDPSIYSRGNSASAANEGITVNSEIINDIRLN
jgi:hypothetical protein